MMETVGNGRDRKGRFVKGSCPNPTGKNGISRKDKELEKDYLNTYSELLKIMSMCCMMGCQT